MGYGIWKRTFFSWKENYSSESFNAHIKNYLKSDLDLVQFFKHFQRAVDDRLDKKVLANVDMSQKISILKVDVHILRLRHARDVYTEPAFDMFQDEYEQSLCMIVESCIQRELVYEYKISLLEHSKQYTTTFVHADGFAHCNCKTFEFVGILCGHVIKVPDDLRIKMTIPEHFILKRWIKQARAGCAMDVNEREIIENSKLEMSMSYNLLCSAHVKLVGKAVVCEEAWDLLARNYAEDSRHSNELLNDKHGYFEGMPQQNYTEMLMGDDTSYEDLLGFMSSRNNEVNAVGY
ncbi:hypothetical protein RHSIM_Rhsim02G0233700 [Rhododendron simsii]|uniref:Protein FAR1-RELATED SEQUENCE n=1 Tax=Rhododendron simsii TaxID=118357 RepID=A0A834LVL1_RHOSS|nr:hypothetical protein RHSIM_RhsimUnG0160600 [Rhododendron simsii]KAF7149789.1 hypothetical protein RHSIM_Rhsim02G0233700 [Rhododendron simsii]